MAHAIRTSDAARAVASRAQETSRRFGAGVAGLRRDPEEDLRAIDHAIGADYFHGEEEKGRAIAQIDRDFASLRGDLEHAATRVGAPKPLRIWWTTDVLPQLEEWREFRNNTADWVRRVALEWSALEAWQGRLRAMRELARIQGVTLTSPEPTRLAPTFTERAQRGMGTRVESAWSLGRMGFYAILTISGAIGAHALWRQIRSGRADSESDGSSA